jgi:hypothetical protein
MSVAASLCPACRTQVFRLPHVRTRISAPIDVEPDPDGSLVIEDGAYRVADPTEREDRRRDGQPLWMSHHATCVAPDDTPVADGGKRWAEIRDQLDQKLRSTGAAS